MSEARSFRWPSPVGVAGCPSASAGCRVPGSPCGCSGRGRVSQATAAPVSATGHSTTPATPSTPAPV
ncbi:hypothetical protein GTW38_27535 [Streptomyces sp. SID7804]|nr:hypothetical protein [Streptomyces sp. SID7804]